MHEIITIQLGHQANFLATHYWNTQESYFAYDPKAPQSLIEHDVSFRLGMNAKGEETFTPRALLYDLKGAFGRLRKHGGLYDQDLGLQEGLREQAKDKIWKGKVALHQDPQIPQSEYQLSLENENFQPAQLRADTVRYWSDYNRVHYHPRSIIQLNDYELNSSLLPFLKFETGEELFRNTHREEGVFDHDLRLWAEECDQMQGFQVFASNDDAWAGFASRYLEMLRDEFGKLPIWTWGIGEQQGKGLRTLQAQRMLNAAKAVTEISTAASMYVPVSVPAPLFSKYVQLEKDTQWQISALLSTAIESVTLPTRLRPDSQRRGRLGNVEEALNANGNQRIAQLQCSILDPETPLLATPKPATTDNRVRSRLDLQPAAKDSPRDLNVDLDIDLSGLPRVLGLPRQLETRSHIFSGIECLRGLVDIERDEGELAYARKKRRFANLPVVERYFVHLPYPILDSLPPIFTNASQGKVGIRTSLSTSTRCVKGLQLLKQSSISMASLDEREALGNSLEELSEAYRQGWEGGGESDDDE